MPKTSTETLLVCDNCKKKFTEKAIVKKSLGKGFKIFTPGCKTWEKDGEQWAFFCPHCDQAHFFGFDLAI